MVKKDGARYLVWPIRLRWAAKNSSTWFKTHGWQVGHERCRDGETQFGFMPGFRGVFGWTFHLGRLKVTFGDSVESASAELVPPSVMAGFK